MTSTADTFASSTTKTFLDGTHRVISPTETLAALEPLRVPLGITRLADVTGLDSIGLPVVQAVRPNSRSISVSQGKGIDAASARASALMEAIEGYHAERVSLPLFIGSWAELRHQHGIAAVARIVRPLQSRFHADARLLWVEGTNLQNGDHLLVPFEAVHTDFTLPLPDGSGCFAMGSNGLAAGNHLQEALSHALCEVVERDSFTLWMVGADLESTRIDPGTVDSPLGIALLERYERAGYDLGLWDATSDIGIPVIVAAITHRGDNELSPTFGAHGYGCHPCREIALSRALTEAAQSRLTHIAGSRDDKNKSAYAFGLTPAVRSSIAEMIRGPARHSFADVPDVRHNTIEADVRWELERLAAAGFDEVICVDLTRPGLGIPVVRIIVPGLEIAALVGTLRYGARAQSAARTGR